MEGKKWIDWYTAVNQRKKKHSKKQEEVAGAVAQEVSIKARVDMLIV